MDKRLDTSKSGCREDASSHSKKSKKRSSKRSSMLNSWVNNVQSNQNSDVVPGMEYQHLLWQSNVQQNFPNNGQRLFTTTSDPSMCGYAQIPMTYTMEPVSLPTMYRLYQPVPFSGIRAVHNRPRRHCSQNHPMNMSMNSMGNGYTSLQENGVQSPVPVNYQNGDYASLPPTANKNNEINGDELNSEHRRYSDPGIGSAEASAPTQSEDSDSVDSGSSITTVGRSNKLVLSLIEQMTELKKSNSQLFKELNDTKSELGSMKSKLAQCKYNSSSDYQPGMLSEFIREIRQANKMCEEALVSKVKSVMDEKLNQRSLEVVNLNNQILKLVEEKEESERRISKLEEEVATLRLNANNEGREIAAFEEETLALRRELQEARSSKNLAENHVAKCVNDATRSVTSVSATFVSPYVTSTPVRTALSDTCSLAQSSAPNSISSSTSTSSIHQQQQQQQQQHYVMMRARTSDLAHHFVHEKTAYRTTTDCSPVSTISWTTDENKGPLSSTQSSIAINDPEDATFEETSSLTNCDLPSDSKKEDLGKEDETLGVDTIDQPEDQEVNKEDRDDTIGCIVDKAIELDVAPSTIMTEKRIRGSRKEEESRQKGGSKKSRKKKGNAMTKKSYSEADKGVPEAANENGRRTTGEAVGHAS